MSVRALSEKTAVVIELYRPLGKPVRVGSGASNQEASMESSDDWSLLMRAVRLGHQGLRNKN